jgi:hypothetical protein
MSIDGKGIIGIYSLSTAKPIKIGNFETQFLSFTDKTIYADWVFMAVVPTAPNNATTTNTVGNTANTVNTNNTFLIPSK